MTLPKKLLIVLSIAFHAMVIPIYVSCLVLMAEKEGMDERPLSTRVRTVSCAAKIIIGIGLFSETVFVVYQCNICVQLFHKWRNCNRIIYVQNAPKIGTTVQQHQQQAGAFSASSQLPTNERISEDTNWFSPKESKFYNCQSDSNSNNNIHSSSSYSVKICDKKNNSGEIRKTKTSSTETSLTSDYNLTLNEVIVICAATDGNSRNDNPKTDS